MQIHVNHKAGMAPSVGQTRVVPGHHSRGYRLAVTVIDGVRHVDDRGVSLRVTYANGEQEEFDPGIELLKAVAADEDSSVA